MPEKNMSRRVTAADIARSLGISRATVGFVLNDTKGQTISAGTRERVLAEADRLGYRPHLAARALASGQSKIVLLVLPDWPVEYSMQAHLDEASLALDEAGYSLVTMTRHAGGRARPLWETLQTDLVMGVVPFTDEEAARIRAATGAPVIAPQLVPATLGSDLGYSLGPQLQIEHLVERGHRKIAFARTGDPRLETLSAERERLAAATAERLGVGLRIDTIREALVEGLVDEWRQAGVSGVAAYNDDTAALIVRAAIRAGAAIPHQVAVIGHDDSPLAQRFMPSISTIHVDPAGLGRHLAAWALHAIEGTPAPVAAPITRATVVARETT